MELRRISDADEPDAETTPSESAGRRFAAGPALPVIAATALVASAALFAAASVLAHYGGYVCASLIAFSAVAINRREIVRSATRTGRSASRTSYLISAMLLLAGFALAVGHAWFIARHYG